MYVSIKVIKIRKSRSIIHSDDQGSPFVFQMECPLGFSTFSMLEITSSPLIVPRRATKYYGNKENSLRGYRNKDLVLDYLSKRTSNYNRNLKKKKKKNRQWTNTK